MIFRKSFFVCIHEHLHKKALTKLDKLNKIWWYRKRINTVKDREKEEYTSGILREKNPLAERFFDRKDVEGSFGVVSLN